MSRSSVRIRNGWFFELTFTGTHFRAYLNLINHENFKSNSKLGSLVKKMKCFLIFSKSVFTRQFGFHRWLIVRKFYFETFHGESSRHKIISSWDSHLKERWRGRWCGKWLIKPGSHPPVSHHLLKKMRRLSLIARLCFPVS